MSSASLLALLISDLPNRNEVVIIALKYYNMRIIASLKLHLQ